MRSIGARSLALALRHHGRGQLPERLAQVSAELPQLAEERVERCHSSHIIRSGGFVLASADAPLGALGSPSSGSVELGTYTAWNLPKLRVRGKVLFGPCAGAEVETGIYGGADDPVPPPVPPW